MRSSQLNITSRGKNLAPVYFRIGWVSIPGRGLAVFIGFLIFLILAAGEAKKNHIDFKHILNFSLLVLFIAIPLFGYVFFNLLADFSKITMFPLNLFYPYRLSSSSLMAGLGCFVVIFCYARMAQLPLGRFADTLAFGFFPAAAIGRLGCLLGGCCYGKPTGFFISIFYAGAHRHPTPLYEALGSMFIFILILVYRKHHSHGSGRLFVQSLLIAYPLLRTATEPLRADTVFIAGFWPLPFIICLFSVLTGTIILCRMG